MWTFLVDFIYILDDSHSENIFEPAHDKTYDNTSVTSKDSDQPAHTLSVEGICDQRKV